MRERLLSAVRLVVEAGEPARQPLLFAVEDIHWADEGMLDLIEYLARWSRGTVLIVCLVATSCSTAGRAGAAAASTRRRSRSTRSTAGPRTGTGRGAGYGEAGGETGDLATEVAARSGGNPLLAEEMVNRIVEEGAADTEALPETVHSVLAARLDALTRDERQAVQAASVVGQTFWEGSIAEIRRRPRGAARDARGRCGARTWSCPPPAAGWPASASTRSSTC